MKSFNSVDAWAKYMNENARGKWYIAGGFAAWFHIENYANKDMPYYQKVKSIIAPGDIEISIDKGSSAEIVASNKLHHGTTVKVLQKMIHVDIQIEDSSFISALSRCVDVKGIKVHSVDSLKIAYERAGAAAKAEKREIRLAMLKLIAEKKRIDEASVAAKRNSPRLANQLMDAVNNRR